MDRKPGHLTKSVQEIAGSLFWIKVVLYFKGKGQHVYISKVVEICIFYSSQLEFFIIKSVK